MTSISPNWKRLQSKISTEQPPKKKRHIKKSVKIKPETPDVNTDTQAKIDTGAARVTTSLVEYALWENEGEMKPDVISKLHGKTFILKSKEKAEKKKDTGKYLAIDCEFVGIGPEGTESALARVSIVNFYGHVVYDKFVKPQEKVTDWRTWVSGVTPKHMKDAISFKEAQEEASKIFEGRILVGHALHHDLDSLFLSHPKSCIRDTSSYKPFKKISMGKTPSLKKLTKHFLNVDIQTGSHSSVEDARATMLIFRLHKAEFERSLRS